MSSKKGNRLETKRASNRDAQRKFRRQRKDYIARLEREVALYRAGGDTALTECRKEVEKLRERHQQLQDLLLTVSSTLRRITEDPVPSSRERTPEECFSKAALWDSDVPQLAITPISEAIDPQPPAFDSQSTDSSEHSLSTLPPYGPSLEIPRGPSAPSNNSPTPTIEMTVILMTRKIDDYISRHLDRDLLESQPWCQIEARIANDLVSIFSEQAQITLPLLNVETVSMYGGSNWVLWQWAKTLLRQRCECLLGEEKRMAIDCGPEWLKPTEIQMTLPHFGAIDLIPWPEVRDRLILFPDILSLDDFFGSLVQRWVPSGAEEDIPRPVNELPVQVQSFGHQPFHDVFYGYLGMWKVRRTSSPRGSISAQVDELIEGYLAD
ncbi:hypothetical protein BDW75DRAFT_245789 [Aspergillus navahoensis]